MVICFNLQSCFSEPFKYASFFSFETHLSKNTSLFCYWITLKFTYRLRQFLTAAICHRIIYITAQNPVDYASCRLLQHNNLFLCHITPHIAIISLLSSKGCLVWPNYRSIEVFFFWLLLEDKNYSIQLITVSFPTHQIAIK